VTIDWNKALARPNSKQKVEGKNLLKLKEEMERLEAKLEDSEERFGLAKEKYEATEESFREIIDRASQKEKNLTSRIESLKAKLEDKQTLLKEKKKELEYYIGPANDTQKKPPIKSPRKEISSNSFAKIGEEIEELKYEMGRIKARTKNELMIDKMEISQINNRLDNLIENIDKTIPETNKEIERLKEELKVKDKQIKITKKDLNRSIISKDKIISKLESDLEAKIAEISDLNNTIDALYTQINKTKTIPKLVKNIIDIMEHKGYISDKEFEKLLEKELTSVP
jgi:chromosome segregation ATPase